MNTERSRLEALESRYTHQEMAVEYLTRLALEQQRRIDSLQRDLEQITALLREWQPPLTGPLADEPPPPHY